MELQTLRDGMRVHRYHTSDLIVAETVGHHTCGVLSIIHYLYYPELPSPELTATALYHDVEEQWTGDIPATFKWDAPSVASLVEAKEIAWRQLMKMPEYTLTQPQQDLLKFADMMDLCYKCVSEVALGNQTVRRMLVAGMDVCIELADHLPEAISAKAHKLLGGL